MPTATSLARALLLCLSLAPLVAAAHGPSGAGGVVVTLPLQSSIPTGTGESGNVTFGTLLGPALSAGYEVGERFNHELAFEFTQVMGPGSRLPFRGGAVDVAVTVRTFAGRYTFSVDFLKKRGLTPSVGAGVTVGLFTVRATNLTVTYEYLWQIGPYLEFHALAGARYTFANGLGLRAHATLSSYGGFVALIPTVGMSYRL